MLAEYKPGDKIRQAFLLRLFKIGTSSTGGPYARGTASDNSGTVNFIAFEREVVETLKQISAPTVMAVWGSINNDRYANDGSKQLLISRAETPNQHEDLSHLLPCSPKDLASYSQALDELIEGLQKNHLKELLHKIFSGDRYEQFLKNPCATKMHHAYLGGLLEHSVDVARLARSMAKEIPAVDLDLVTCGALLHDIGKLEEISPQIGFEYTSTGRMIGHLGLSALLADRMIRTMEEFPAEDAVRLIHILLSHHGEPEKGSPVSCATREGFLVHYADEINAVMNQFPAEPTGEWQYCRMLNRFIEN